MKTSRRIRGFTLIELLVVVAILGILATSVGVHINSSKTKLKTFVFNTKTRFNQARFEAVKRGRSVYLDFDIDNNGLIDSDGYTIWVDDNYFNARSMDVYITKLRKHLKDDASVEILNVHGKGYKLVM